LSRPRRLTSLPLAHILLLVSIAELSINRLAVVALRPPADTPPPTWHAVLDYVGLFLLYFATALAVGMLVAWGVARLRRGLEGSLAQHARGVLDAALIFVFVAVAVVCVVTTPNDTLSFALETLFAVAVIPVVVRGVLASSDLGASIGLVLVASPLLVHYYGVAIGHELFEHDLAHAAELADRVQHYYGVIAVCVAALASPYCFAPRPLARSLPRPAPLVVSLIVIGLGAVLVRQHYSVAIMVARQGAGIDLGAGVPSGQMALYLLALATIAWTLTACGLSEIESRRDVGVGLGLLVLGGYGFAWPLSFLLGIAGLVTVADAMPRLGPEEGGAGPRTPPIDDDTWQAYTSAVRAALRDGDHDVSAVTSRGDGIQTTVIATDRGGAGVAVRLEREAGALRTIEVTCGAPVTGDGSPTLTVTARGEGWMAGRHPEPPAASPVIRTGDGGFDRRFRCRGDGRVLYELFDDGLRSRAAAVLDGWLAYWTGQALVWRLHPGLGASIDHPVPVGDLARRRAGDGAAERLASVVELIAAIAARGEVAAPRRAEDHELHEGLHDEPAEAAPAPAGDDGDDGGGEDA
jgi:hypothetical protein